MVVEPASEVRRSMMSFKDIRGIVISVLWPSGAVTDKTLKPIGPNPKRWYIFGSNMAGFCVQILSLNVAGIE